MNIEKKSQAQTTKNEEIKNKDQSKKASAKDDEKQIVVITMNESEKTQNDENAINDEKLKKNWSQRLTNISSLLRSRLI